METLQVKRFTTPDETRPFRGHGSAALLKFGEQDAVGLGTFEAGWRWSTDLGPIVGTKSCQVRHEGYCLSGRMLVRMDSGEELEFGPGDVAVIPPGHDAWVLGDETCRFLDFGGASQYALPAAAVSRATEATRPPELRPH